MCGVSICEEQAKFSLSTKKSKVFHHTQTQTKQSMNTGRERTNLKSCNTQTYKMISRTCQSNHERSTQIESSLIRESPSIIGSIGDEKMLTPKQYFSSDQLFALKYQKTILLQKNWRGYAGRKQGICSKLTLQTKHRNVQKEIYFSEGREGGDYILFEMKDSNRKITADSPSIETVKRSKYIRGSSTELIDLKSTKANTTIPRRLQRLIEPTEWTLSNEVVVQVQNPSTVRAEKWVSLYKKISQVDHVCVDERLTTLLRLKQMVNESNANALTKDISDLIDREADLLHRGRGIASLEGLRKRLCSLLLTFIEENSKHK